MARNRGQFGNPSREIRDHYRALEMAALILEGEHGTVHKSGERIDLCPKCALDAKHSQSAKASQHD
jgi:hypothetical protein